MVKKFELQVNEPCHESWESMTDADRGRFCGSCQKVVMDFTGMSDEQLVAFFKKPSTGSVCGRFNTDQLNKEFTTPRKRIPWLRYFFQISLPAFLFSLKANGQKQKPRTKTLEEVVVTTPVQQTHRTMGIVARPPVKQGHTWTGKVMDETDQTILAGVVIRITYGDSREDFFTDEQGQFAINQKQIPALCSPVSKGAPLRSVSFISPGYQPLTLSFADFEARLKAKTAILLVKAPAIVIEQTIRGEVAVVVKKVMDKPVTVVTGIVTDEKGERVPGAFVHIKGLADGTETDANGVYRLNTGAIKNNLVLVVSAIGFSPTEKEADLTKSASCDIMLFPEREQIIMGLLISKPVKKNKKEVSIIPEQKPDGNLLKVFPNPASAGNTVIIEARELPAGVYTIAFTNISGQVIFSAFKTIDTEGEQGGQIPVTIPAVKPGIYFIRATSRENGKVFAEKIVIE
jgi:CarboxypepD_reg-like domain/Secretion system C-terminal sorting domain